MYLLANVSKKEWTLEKANRSGNIRVAKPLLKEGMADISSIRFGGTRHNYQPPYLNRCCGRQD